MKLIYKRPTTEIITISVAKMIANSQVEDGFDPNDVDVTDETSGNLSRRHNNVWDDEEEEKEDY
jgi:hypothetical protein